MAHMADLRFEARGGQHVRGLECKLHNTLLPRLKRALAGRTRKRPSVARVLLCPPAAHVDPRAAFVGLDDKCAGIGAVVHQHRRQRAGGVVVHASDINVVDLTCGIGSKKLQLLALHNGGEGNAADALAIRPDRRLAADSPQLGGDQINLYCVVVCFGRASQVAAAMPDSEDAWLTNSHLHGALLVPFVSELKRARVLSAILQQGAKIQLLRKHNFRCGQAHLDRNLQQQRVFWRDNLNAVGHGLLAIVHKLHADGESLNYC